MDKCTAGEVGGRPQCVALWLLVDMEMKTRRYAEEFRPT